MLGVMCAVITIQGGILLAAAKSIFVTKIDHEADVQSINNKLYDGHSVTVFVPRTEWEKSRDDRERRRDNSQRKLCDQIAEIQKSNKEISAAVNNLIGRFDQKYVIES